MYCYDYIITFGEEVRCVWKRRASGASILFVLGRYAMLAASLASITQVLPWNQQPDVDIDGGVYDTYGSVSTLCPTAEGWDDHADPASTRAKASGAVKLGTVTTIAGIDSSRISAFHSIFFPQRHHEVPRTCVRR